MFNHNTIPRWFKLYSVLITLFCVVAVLSNLITVKLFQAPFSGNMALPTGMLTYPLTFLIGDLVTEIFGPKKARFMVYLGFSMSFVAHLIILAALKLPPHSSTNQQAFEWVFGLNGLAVYTSMAAYLIGQVVDIQLFAILRKWTRGKHLWLRNNVSTLVSQLLDTIFVNATFLYFGLGIEPLTIAKIIVVSYAYKGIISITNTPLFSLAVNMSKKYIKEKVPAVI